MSTTRTINDPWPPKPKIEFTKEELRALYHIQALMSYRYRHKVVNGKRVRLGRFVSDDEMQEQVESVLAEHERLGRQLGILLELNRPKLFRQMTSLKERLGIHQDPPSGDAPSGNKKSSPEYGLSSLAHQPGRGGYLSLPG